METKHFNFKHGHKTLKGASPTYQVWVGMKARCADKGNIDYGGRGISVCDRWKLFDLFLEDMGERPEGRTLDRIDLNKDYEKGNCRWATLKEQGRNKSNNVIIEINGVRKCLAQWAEDCGIKYHALHRRIRHGWSIERALFDPIYGSGESSVAARKPEVMRRGEGHPHSKLNDVAVKALYLRYKRGGITQAALAAEYGVSEFSIHEVVNGRRFKHVTKGLS